MRRSQQAFIVLLALVVLFSCARRTDNRSGQDSPLDHSVEDLYGLSEYESVLSVRLESPSATQSVLRALSALALDDAKRFDREIADIQGSDDCDLENLDIIVFVRGYVEHIWTDEMMGRYLDLLDVLMRSSDGSPSWTTVTCVRDALGVLLTHPWRDRVSESTRAQMMTLVAATDAEMLARTPLGHTGSEVD